MSDSARIVAAVVAAIAVTACTPQSPRAERIFINGKIVTVDSDFGIEEAIAVRGDRIVAVGSSATIERLAGETTTVVDLGGRTVIPGLIDNHLHFVRAARDWYRHVRWDGVTSREEAKRLVAERARALPPQEWIIVVGGWTFEQFVDDASLFTVAELDAMSPDRPLYVQEGYRRGFANTRALAAAGLGADASFDGRGVMGIVDVARPAVPDDVWDASLRQTVADLHSMGLTSVYDVGGGGVTPAYYDAVARAADAERLTMRVFYALNPGLGVGPSATEIIAALTASSPDLVGLQFARFGWGESTYGPMRAQPWQISEQDLEAYEAIALAAARGGWQLHEHSMRDVKIDAMLTVFEAVDVVQPIQASRWTIAHTNGISAKSITRANALGVVFAVHSSSRLATAQAVANGTSAPPIRSIEQSGAIWGLGSDATAVASPNPFHNIGWAVTGMAPSGEINLTQTVSREAALTAHTRTNAYLLFREAHLGSIEVGKLADFVVLDRDFMTVPATEIKDLRALLTVVGGQVVFADPAF